MICEYIIGNNDIGFPELIPIRESNMEREEMDGDLIENLLFLRDFTKMDIRDVETAYVMALDYLYRPLGILQLSIGDYKSCMIYSRATATFLLLSGARRFIVIHNHPSGQLKASDADVANKLMIESMANLLEIEFEGSFIITRDGWKKVGTEAYDYWDYGDEDEEEDVGDQQLSEYEDPLLDQLLLRMVKDLEDTRDIYYGYSYVRTIRNILVGKDGAVIAPFFKGKTYYGVCDTLELATVEKILDGLVSQNQLSVIYIRRGKLYCTNDYYASTARKSVITNGE